MIAGGSVLDSWRQPGVYRLRDEGPFRACSARALRSLKAEISQMAAHMPAAIHQA